MTKLTMGGLCECADSGCPVHAGKSECHAIAAEVLKRIDMEDRNGVAFCEPCASDAAESGVFA